MAERKEAPDKAIKMTVYHADGRIYTGDPVDCKELINIGGFSQDPVVQQQKQAAPTAPTALAPAPKADQPAETVADEPDKKVRQRGKTP